MSEITLAVRGLRKVIGGREIIRGIDLELRRGEVFGFLGPNGAGKTTTIRMLVGLIRPTAGTIEVCGYDVDKQFPQAMSNLGCIVENPELYGYLSGWSNLQYFARMMDGVDEARIREVVELVGLSARIHDKVKTYSLGMRQRVGIAQALLGRPKVLILDEPTNGLDPSGIREMREFIRFLAEKEGLTVFVSSHLLGEIQQLCDRVAIISKGEVVRVDAVHTLLSRQERVLWKLSSPEKGRQVLEGLTPDVERQEEYVVTPYQEGEIGRWNRALVEAGVDVLEMNRKLQSLEDLFLELTGGQSID
ncbi:ABC transporter ATP-binding protein [Paenibacillus mucilaginosus]|uniref:ABC transporter ATP-binding protein n=1 Tax=Paenibacillus mucilaginosus (strain KNP414) TaxID=1036673 RepID=F8FIW7_PAEMK|nr:ABC transporter ATP-binding protein [Paenibacillus mucilaginosus]AEI46345.1 ABC transporter ATP-binding protein [Paenibacillus mucilaginosus KNP414]MCG7213541.1 ABC transporter ATP-binding protein [Paenibacillus mucilaginosus]WDM27643.1 ABC transporter ATP-binding protein [Paenibacillus mucilaginosus]